MSRLRNLESLARTPRQDIFLDLDPHPSLNPAPDPPKWVPKNVLNLTRADERRRGKQFEFDRVARENTPRSLGTNIHA